MAEINSASGMRKNVSVVIPAYNEEKNIEAAIESVVAAIRDVVDDYEVIVVDDGSVDSTRAIANAKAQSNSKIKVIFHDTNQGYGRALYKGIQSAAKDYISAFPGDNDATAVSLKNLILEMGSADVIISYMYDMKHRSLLRRGISRSFTFFMNCLFGLKLKYYNGIFLFKRTTVQSFTIKSTGLVAIAEYTVRMIKAGCSYKQVPFDHTGRKTGKSTALILKSLKSVLATLWILVDDIYLRPTKKAD